MTLEHGIALELEEKAVRDDGDTWLVTGYASIFGNRDLGGDIVMEGRLRQEPARARVAGAVVEPQYERPAARQRA